MVDDDVPVLIGAGQFVLRDRVTTVAQALPPVELAARAARTALDDAGCTRDLASEIDVVAVVRFNADSVPKAVAKLGHPFGTTNNVPVSIARRLGAQPRQAIYSPLGGQTPQRLVNEFAERIHRGECRMVLIAGAEAVAITKQALKAGLKPDWNEQVEGPLEDRGLGTPLSSQYEIAHGLTFPVQVYPLLEHAWRRRQGLTPTQHRHAMAELFAAFSQVAADNPYAQFPTAHEVDFLAADSAENYRLASPYARWLVAQETVNQAAAVVMTSAGTARALGIPAERWVYLHGYADADDALVSERPDLSASLALKLAAQGALQAAGRRIEEMELLDFYSCFPIAVFAACEALGIDWRNPGRPLTVTGGLPFFGGPGNNYSLHAIAEMVRRLRRSPAAYGLVTANGGFLSKHSAGVYSSQPIAQWQPCSSESLRQQMQAQPRVARADSVKGACGIESFTVVPRDEEWSFGYVVARDEAGQRLLAKVASEDELTLKLLGGEDPVGKKIDVVSRDGKNYFRFAGTAPLKPPRAPERLRDSYKDCVVERRGAVLLVTINRPEAMNAVTPETNREMAQIINAYEDDPELRVAIVTGAGDKAFSAGNDLKYTLKATLAQMRQPDEGFGGLTSNFERKKPVIAAVNGIAYGGGFEIALAADIVIASRNARFALPEPKVGLAALAGGIHRLVRQVPLKRAMAMMLTGDHIDAAEAMSLGFVNEVVEPERLLEASFAFAEKILACSPTAVAVTREAALEGLSRADLQEAMKLDTRYSKRIFKSPDFKEGLKAFAEKRKPAWQQPAVPPAQWSFGDVFDFLPRHFTAGRIAVYCGSRCLSWGELDARSNRLARALLQGGLVSGDKVAIYARNSIEYVIALVAVFKARFVHVNVNYRYQREELRYVLDHSDAAAVIHDAEFTPELEALLVRLPSVKLRVEITPEGDSVSTGALSFRVASEQGDASPLMLERSPDDLIFVLTGGTTGMPKAVMWRQHDLFQVVANRVAGKHTGVPKTWNALADSLVPEARAGAMLVAAPLMHGAGLFVAFSALIYGYPLVLLEGRRFDAETVLRTIEARRVVTLFAVGDAMLKPLLKALDTGAGHRVDSLRLVMSSGAPWSVEAKRPWFRHAPKAALVDNIGSSEAAAFGTSIMTADGVQTTAPLRMGPNTKVFTADLREVEPGSGEAGFVARGGQVPIGYYKDPEKSAQTFREIGGQRYSIPGDWCEVERDGTLKFLGRGNACINSGGEKIYPQEVEYIVAGFPGVEDVVIVGVPDERWGQAVTAIVQVAANQSLDVDALRAHVRAHLADYKVPKHVLMVASMDRGPNGKADYARLRQLAATRLTPPSQQDAMLQSLDARS